MSFEDMKRNKRTISQQLELATANNSQVKSGRDERLWIPAKDKAGNGYAVIRFLPGKFEQPSSVVEYWEHAFKGPTGQWYIEKSLTTIGKQDAIAEMNSKLWNSGIEADKVTVRQRKRNKRHVCNVLIISDPANPENEGQVKLFRFGTKIMDKINEARLPQFPDQVPFEPTDLDEGADFKLKIRKVEGYANYDISTFESPKSLFGGDEELQKKIYAMQVDLREFTDPEGFKSYDELKERLNAVLGLDNSKASQAVEDSLSGDYVPFADAPAPVSAPEPVYAEATAWKPEAEAAKPEDDDIMAKFRALADD